MRAGYLLTEETLGNTRRLSLKPFYSVVYQDFARYSISIRDNIAIGCVGGADDEAINNAITALKLDSVIEGLEDGKDTLLGKLAQEGKDLSGGEWQRTALISWICPKQTVKQR